MFFRLPDQASLDMQTDIIRAPRFAGLMFYVRSIESQLGREVRECQQAQTARRHKYETPNLSLDPSLVLGSERLDRLEALLIKQERGERLEANRTITFEGRLAHPEEAEGLVQLAEAADELEEKEEKEETEEKEKKKLGAEEVKKE